MGKESENSGQGNGNPLQYSCLKFYTEEPGYSPWGPKESDMNERTCTRTHTNTNTRVYI